MGATDRFLKRGRIQDFSRSPIAKMLSELRKFGANGHLYIPGVGAISGITAGNYLDSLGTTQATVDGNDGLVLDGAGSVGAELLANGDFANGLAAWTVDNADATHVVTAYAGKCSYLSDTTSPQLILRQTVSIGAEKTYLLTLDVSAYVSGQIRVEIGGSISIIPAGAGKKQVVVRSASAYNRFIITRSTANVDLSITNISVREVTGIHASQSTTGYQPKLRRGIVNLLTWSNDLTNGAYGTTNSTVATVDGAQKLIANAGVAQHYKSRTYTQVVGNQYTRAVSVKPGGFNWIWFYGGNPTVHGYFNIATGEIGSVTGGVTPTISLGSDGYYTVAFAVVGSTTAGAIEIHPVSANGAGVSTNGNGSDGIFVKSVGVFDGTLTASQILAYGGITLTTSAPASSSSGAYKLDFDGTDDFMSLSSIPFQMADDHCVIAAVRPNSTNIGKHILNPANGAASQQVGCIRVDGASKYTASWCDDTTTVASVADSAALNVGESSVVTARKIGSVGALRKNGLQIGSTNLSAIGATTLTLPGVLGAFKSGAEASNIHLHGAAVIKGTVIDSQVLIFERGLNAIAQYAAGRW